MLDQLLGVNKAGTSSTAQDQILFSVAGQNAASLPTLARALAGDIHAASTADHEDETEGVMMMIRSIVGPQIPVIATHDLHCNV